jgi:hypothetical protein
MNDNITELTEIIKKLTIKNTELQSKIKTLSYDKQQKIAKSIGLNNTEIIKNEEILKNEKDKLTDNTPVLHNIEKKLIELNSQKEYYLKLLNRAYEILIKKLSGSQLKKGRIYGVKFDKNTDEYIIKQNIKIIKAKIKILQ